MKNLPPSNLVELCILPMMLFPRRTALFFDALILLVLGGLVLHLVAHSAENVTSPWEWQALWRAFFHTSPEHGGFVPGPLGLGLINTLRLACVTIVTAGIVGHVLGLLRSSRLRLARMVGTVWVNLTRNMPPLVLVFIVHFFLGDTLSAHIPWEAITRLPLAEYLLPPASRMPVFFSAVVTLSLYEGAYVGEIIRAGINSVAPGQWEAAASLGFSRFQRLRLIIFPQALRFIMPPLTAQGASLIKDSAIVSVISVQELTFQGTEYMTSSGLMGEVWLAVAVCYLVMCLVLSGVGQVMERRVTRFVRG